MNIDFDIKCTSGGFALEYPTNECLRNIGGGGGGGPGGTGPTGPTGPFMACAFPPLQIGTTGCIEMTPAAFCGAIHQYVNNAWGIYRSPGITEVTVGFPGNNIPPGNNYPTVAAAIMGAGNTNCLFIRVTDTIGEGAITAPGGGLPLLIYVDPEVTWTCTSIDCMNSNLTLIGNSSDTSQFVVTGQITNCSSVTVSDCNLTFQGFIGTGEVHIRNSTLSCGVNILAITLSLLEVSDSVISLELVALCLTSTTVVKLTRIDINANLPSGGDPTMNRNTGGFIFLNSAFTEINEMTYNGNLGDMVLTNGYMSNVSDISPPGPSADPRNLTIRIGNIGPPYDPLVPVTNQPMREINEFQNGRYIADESPTYNAPATVRIWRNLFIRGAQIQWLLLPNSAGTTILVNCHFSHINVTGPVGPAGSVLFRPRIGGSFIKSSIVDITIPQTTTNEGFPTETLFLINDGSSFSPSNNFKVTNFECGNINCGGAELEFSNIKALHLTCFVSGTFSSTYTNMYLRNLGNVNTAQFWGMGNGRMNNIFVEQDAWIQGMENTFSNMIITGTMQVTIPFRNSWSNIRCGSLLLPAGLSNYQSFDNFNDIVILGVFDLTLSNTKFTNLTCFNSFTISGNFNDIANVIVQNMAAGISIYGDGNKLENCRSFNTAGGTNSVLIRGSQNQITNFTIPGCSSGGTADPTTRQAFEVSGCLNKFENIQLGEMTRIPITSSSGSDPFIFTLDNMNTSTYAGAVGYLTPINSPPMMPPATGPAPMTGWQSLFQPGNCFCVGSQIAAAGVPEAEFKVLTVPVGVAGQTVITATGPSGYVVGTPGLYVLTPNPLDQGAFGNMVFAQSGIDSPNLGGGGLINFGGSNNHYTNVEIYPKRNTITRFPVPPPPPILPYDYIILEAHVDVVVSGTFNHFTNLWLYQDPWNYLPFLGYPTGSTIYNPAIGGSSFTNQNLYISGEYNTFVNCKVGPSCSIGTPATPGTETFVATGPASNNKVVSSWARSPFTGVGWSSSMVSWSAGINDTFS